MGISENFQNIATQFNGEVKKGTYGPLDSVVKGKRSVEVTGCYLGHSFSIKNSVEGTGGGGSAGGGSGTYLYIDFRFIGEPKVPFFKIKKKGILNVLFNESSFYAKESKLEQSEINIGSRKYLISSDELGTVLSLMKDESISSSLNLLLSNYPSSIIEVTKPGICWTKQLFFNHTSTDKIIKTLEVLNILARSLEK